MPRSHQEDQFIDPQEKLIPEGHSRCLQLFKALKEKEFLTKVNFYFPNWEIQKLSEMNPLDFLLIENQLIVLANLEKREIPEYY